MLRMLRCVGYATPALPRECRASLHSSHRWPGVGRKMWATNLSMLGANPEASVSG